MITINWRLKLIPNTCKIKVLVGEGNGEGENKAKAFIDSKPGWGEHLLHFQQMCDSVSP